MTKEEFNNQKWYKNMPVWANEQKCYVHAVNFLTGKIDVIYKIGDTSSVAWNFCMVKLDPPQPTALDLIAQEREKQISKGYTVGHDAKEYPNSELVDIATSLIYNNWHQVPEGWSKDYWKILCSRPYKDRLRIAGALIAAELDRVINEEKEANQ